MGWWRALFLVLICRTYHITHAQDDELDVCVLQNSENEKDFPNLEKEGIFSFQMSVEYSVPNSKQTDYYNEYYDISQRRGRVNSHVAGKSLTYIYYTKSMEAFEIGDGKCRLRNVTNTPEFMGEFLTDWEYLPLSVDENQKKGPSAMFQIALEAWNDPARKVEFEMAYMGKSDEKVRGLDAQYWRRCLDRQTFADYYFTTDDHDDAFGSDKLKRIPLRVVFGKTQGESPTMPQIYEILSFQPFISDLDSMFQLPVGVGCERSDEFENSDDSPDLPDFNKKNIMFSSEVVYQTNSDDDVWRYYSTFLFAMDVETQHMAYFFTPWSNNSQDNIDDEPEVNLPEFIVFDMKHGYSYRTEMSSGKCQIGRQEKFYPRYMLPKRGGYVDLTDPAILFPQNELSYITESEDRGLGVHVYEATFTDYDMGTRQVPIVVASHWYLKENEVEQNTVSVKEVLTRIELRMITPEKKLEEKLTFNFYGFTTQLLFKNYLFDISRCFKNDNEYFWVTLKFPADEETITKIKQDIPNIETDILVSIQLKTELNAVRMPNILVDFKDAVYVTILILNKPMIQLDYLDEEKGKTITDSAETDGALRLEDCANQCVEEKDGCWAFSICGATCTFATSSTPNAKIVEKTECSLFRRYDNSSYLPSSQMVSSNLRRIVESKEMKLMLKDKSGDYVTLVANYVEITEPGQDDEMFSRLGNERNPRMKVWKIASRFNSKEGTPVKNLGKLSYAECQRVCLDFKDCESVSYCLDTSECIVSKTYGDDIKATTLEEKNTCIVLSRKYADNFERSPGNVLSLTATKILDLKSVEDCARACLKETGFSCASFDHCANTDKGGCKLHTVYYPNAQTRESLVTNNSNCGHYFKKYSKQFKMTYQKKMVLRNLPTLTNLTLEECAKVCTDYGKGTCFGFDFCQGSAVYATSCIILDKSVDNLEKQYSPICSNYIRENVIFSPRPYTNNLAGGIGFLCLVIGALIGTCIALFIAYARVNRRQ